MVSISERPLRSFHQLTSALAVAVALSACTNGGLVQTSKKTTSNALSGTPVLTNPQPGTSQLSIVPDVIGSFADKVGPLGTAGRGMLLSIERPLTAYAETNNGGLPNFLNQALTDPSFGEQKLTVRLEAQNIRIQIPIRLLVGGSTQSPILNNGVILRANGKAAIVYYPDLPDSSAGLMINESNQLVMYGGLRDGEGMANVVNFSMAGGQGTFLTDNLHLPFGASEQADETIILPTNTDLVNPNLKWYLDAIRYDYKFLYILNDTLCSAPHESQLQKNAAQNNPFDLLPESNPYSVYVIQRKAFGSSVVLGGAVATHDPYLIQVCGYVNGTYRCGAYYSKAYGNIKNWGMCLNKGSYRNVAGSQMGMDDKKSTLIYPFMSSQYLKPTEPPAKNTIPGGFNSNGIVVSPLM